MLDGAWTAVLIQIGLLILGAANRADAAIELCPGLTIVTAVQQSDGDYESIKRITEVGSDSITLHYSSERMVSDFLSSDPPKLVQTQIDRAVRKIDLENAILYLQQFDTRLPRLVPETTAIGASKEVFRKFRAGEEVSFGIFIAFSQTPSLDRNTHPNVYDNQMIGKLKRLSPDPVMVSVIVDQRMAELPAIHVGGDILGDMTELWFLDDIENPITLRYRFGIGTQSIDAETAKMLGIEEQAPADRERFDVIKISTLCESAGNGGGGGAGDGGAGGGGAGDGSGGSSDADAAAVESFADAVEAALKEDGKADIYSIYFSFASAEMRPESDVALRAVAAILARNPEWIVTINGHTDSIDDADVNQALSEQRAGATRDALVSRFKVKPSRLRSAGYGESQPVADNDEVEGRALNRRVEIVLAQ